MQTPRRARAGVSHLAKIVLIVAVASGCGAKKPTKGSASAKASGAPSGAAVINNGGTAGLAATLPEGGQVQPADPSKLTIKYTEQVNASGSLMFNMTNDTGKAIHWVFVHLYAYDKDGKQLDFAGGEKVGKTSWTLTADVAPGQKASEPLGLTQADIPAGTAFLQTIVTQLEDRDGNKLYNLEVEPSAVRAMSR